MEVKSESEVAQLYPTLSDPWTAAYQAPLSMGFSRQEYWSVVPLPSPHIELDPCFMFFLKFILFLAALGLHWCSLAFSSCSERGLLRRCSAWVSHCSGFSYCRARALGHTGFSSCPMARGIFRGQESNPCPLHWQADSYSLNHQGRSPLCPWHNYITRKSYS